MRKPLFFDCAGVLITPLEVLSSYRTWATQALYCPLLGVLAKLGSLSQIPGSLHCTRFLACSWNVPRFQFSFQYSLSPSSSTWSHLFPPCPPLFYPHPRPEIFDLQFVLPTICSEIPSPTVIRGASSKNWWKQLERPTAKHKAELGNPAEEGEGGL